MKKYIDKSGDVWQEVSDGFVRVVRTGGSHVDESEPWDVDYVSEKWGPLHPVEDDEAADAPSDDLPRVAEVMDRATVFQSAHALVTGLEWGEEKPSVYDVLNVAKWLEGESA